MGEHQLGVVTADDFPLCKAVAASSAFPPVFPPLRINVESYAYAEGEYVALTDGGVYDNLGVNPLLRERNELDYAIVSDGGKPFENNERPTESGAVVLYESINILMEQVRGLQFKRLELAHQSGKGPKPLWFSIDSQIGESQPGDASFASAIGTNLKKLNAAEMAVLTRHSGALLNHRLTTYANELLTAS
jgi:NTE family protein